MYWLLEVWSARTARWGCGPPPVAAKRDVLLSADLLWLETQVLSTMQVSITDMGYNEGGTSAALRGWVGLVSFLQVCLLTAAPCCALGNGCSSQPKLYGPWPFWKPWHFPNLQLGVAVAVICITYFKLSHISSFHVDVGTRSYNATGTCLLDSNTSAPGALPLRPPHACMQRAHQPLPSACGMPGRAGRSGYVLHWQACACTRTQWQA